MKEVINFVKKNMFKKEIPEITETDDVKEIWNKIKKRIRYEDIPETNVSKNDWVHLYFFVNNIPEEKMDKNMKTYKDICKTKKKMMYVKHYYPYQILPKLYEISYFLPFSSNL